MNKWEVGSIYRRDGRYFLILDDGSTTWIINHSKDSGLNVSPIGEQTVQDYQRVRGFQVLSLRQHWGISRQDFDSLILKYLDPYRFVEAAKSRQGRLPLLLKKLLLISQH